MGLHGFDRYYLVEKRNGNTWRRANFPSQKSQFHKVHRVDKSFDNYSQAEKAVTELAESEAGLYQIVEFTICRYPKLFGSLNK